MSEMINFDTDTVAIAPAGWISGVTGDGVSRWTVEQEPSAPSQPIVLRLALRQSGKGDFPWCVRRGTAISDGYVEVKFMAVSGREDGGWGHRVALEGRR